MKITTTPEKFETQWEPTGEMIKESPTSFIQTYKNSRFEGKFVQKKVNTPFGQMIELTSV